MSENPKSTRTEARKPRGLADRGPADIAATEAMLATIREVYARYGFEALETPFLEYTDALGKFLPDQDRPNAGVFSLRDDDEQWMSLRYDLTAPLARYCAENWQNLPKPYRSYRAGWVFRNEKPGPGRFRQFMQFDADTVGAASVAADAEICMMAADTMEKLGIPRGQYVIKVNNRKVLDGVLESIDLGGAEHAATRLTVLRAIDKADKFPWPEIAKLLGTGRKDESGDFTKGAGLDARAIDQIEIFCNFKKLATSGGQVLEDVTHLSPDARLKKAEASGSEVIPFGPSDGEGELSYFLASNKGVIDALAFHFDNPKSREGLDELRAIAELVQAAGYLRDRIRIDPSVVRGLEYYTGPVYEAELLFDTLGEDGRPVRFGSVGGGGRYDGLVSRFLNEPVPATGFSIGVSRLLAALQALGKVAVKPVPGPVLVLAMPDDQKNPEAMAGLQKIVSALRNSKNEKGEHDIRAELYLGSSGMKAQMKYADRRGSPVAIIQGSSEREKGTAQIKDLILGGELANATKGEDRADYIATMKAEAQFEVPVAEIVERVREVLARRA
jgi:histidyl-tRNA synthetase